MKIMIVGGGGREHVLAWKIAQSPLCEALYCMPGNPGIAAHAECLPLPCNDAEDPAERWSGAVEACRARAVDLVVVGPERPLAEGLADALIAAGLKVFGPTQDGARLESSKRFAKELMLEAGIPTAAAETFTDYAAAVAWLDAHPGPCVIKASGLAEGKGVTVARTHAEALEALDRMMRDRVFGAAADEVLIEERLIGEEASLLAFTDGATLRCMASAQDHKPVYDGDEGPNTGGMGAYSPAPVVTPELYARCVQEIMEPCLAALRARGIHYCGVIYAGLMITEDGPRVIEFNCRFGDPEAQAVLPRLKNDLVEVMLACVEGRLDRVELEWAPGAAICVVLASGGYPGPYEKGKPIEGLGTLPPGVLAFHAGTARDDRGRIVTAGGRVLGLTVQDEFIRVAHERVYEWVEHVRFEGRHYRSDIARRALGGFAEPRC